MRAHKFLFIIIFYDSHDLELGEIDLGETDPYTMLKIHVNAY